MFHLLYVVIDNDTLTRVLQSVTRNISMLVQVMMLMGIVIYFYSLWAFALRRSDFDQESYGEFCTSSWVCFMTSLKVGLIYGGGLGEALIYGGEPGKPGFRTIFDISYFMIIICISLSGTAGQTIYPEV